jgi:cell division ATPase FtsA
MPCSPQVGYVRNMQEAVESRRESIDYMREMQGPIAWIVLISSAGHKRRMQVHSAACKVGAVTRVDGAWKP